MSKQTIPGIQAGGSALRKIVGPALLITILIFVTREPVQAAEWTRTFFSQLGGFLNALRTFLEEVSA
ncbi:hypothetical protein [Actinopolyspora mortivallis]|uniref:hypothetical protein n=1 Tax=Actinopolyspora mortivallis TaxID=33906 RepID=UPI0011B21AF7|nr:hypothetical protein [Actinopolyspora mortivallis]